jgi:putative transcriptional regulator
MSEAALGGHGDSGRIAAYALGALEEAERREVEAHLGGCVACAEELQELDRVAASFARAVPARPPASRVRAQVLDLAGAPPVPDAMDEADPAWVEMEPGISLRILHEDPRRGLRTCLLWGRPGARQTHHRHDGDEAILVLKGTLRDQRGTYPAGSVCSNRAGSEHAPEVAPPGDCVCYVVQYGFGC